MAGADVLFAIGHPSSVNVYGRRVPVPWATEKACRFTFAELCEEVSE
jgi:predicted ATPase